MIKGLIFDFDGLLVDTESPAYDSWLEIYREYGCTLPLSLWSAVLGGSGAEFDPCAYLAEQTGRSLDADVLRARRLHGIPLRYRPADTFSLWTVWAFPDARAKIASEVVHTTYAGIGVGITLNVGDSSSLRSLSD